MQRFILALFFVLFASTTCFADSIDDLNAAIRAMKGNQTHAAKQLLAKVIQDINSSNEHKAQAYYLYSIVEKDPAEAIVYCSKAIDLAPNDSRYYEKLGVLYYQTHDYENAIKNLDKAISITPISAEAYSLRGLAYRDLGNIEKALPDLDKAITLDPNVGVYYARRGVARFQANQQDGALEDLTKALERNLAQPIQANCYFYAAKIYMNKHQYDKAKALFSASLNIMSEEDKIQEARKLLEQIRIADKWS